MGCQRRSRWEREVSKASEIARKRRQKERAVEQASGRGRNRNGTLKPPKEFSRSRDSGMTDKPCKNYAACSECIFV